MDFTDFNLHPGIIAGIDSMGYKTPTPIQREVIPHILGKRDLIGCAQTGTGKTAAYLLPLLHQIINSLRPEGITSLIIAPTRELAQQIDLHFQGLAYFTGISSMAIYGGTDGSTYEKETRALEMHTDLIIATPGRLISHLTMNHINTRGLQHLVLDEADRMLDMGFYDDIMQIISHLPGERQTLMFSATMPPEIRKLARKILHNPVEVSIAVSKPAEGILEAVCMVEENLKQEVVYKLLNGKDYLRSVLVFTATRRDARRLEKEFAEMGLLARAMHADLDQQKREEILRGFVNRKIQVLVATNLLSRGIDIDNIDLVINYNVPADPDDYIHRIGRTARASNTGVAITLVSGKEKRELARIEHFLGRKIYRMQI